MAESALRIRDQRVKPRFKIAVHARIKAQLIGSFHKLLFITENISESGLLVNHAVGARPGFNPQTILEVWLFDEAQNEIFFFAKYVRRASDTSFAMKIIDIDTANAKLYHDFINSHRDSMS